MIYWKDFDKDFEFNIEGKSKKVCNNIFVLDIETTSLIKLDNQFFSASEYQNLDKKSQEQCEFLAFSYIWQMSIDDKVYYGRTFDELKEFFEIIYNLCKYKKIVFVHNLSFEFSFLCSHFEFSKVLARKCRHVMTAEIEKYNFEFRCSLYMSNVALKILAKTYKLPVQKLEGDLNYDIIRNSKTILTDEELKYCENDCLVVYYYILLELKTYKRVDKIPITFTGHIRKELQKLIQNDWSYKREIKKAVNTDGHIYNLLIEAFSGGFTHANWFYTGKILKNVDSFDECSEYPFCMVSEKYPSTEFKKANITKKENMSSRFAYILVVKFKNIKSKYYNNFISMSKCRKIEKRCI